MFKLPPEKHRDKMQEQLSGLEEKAQGVPQ